VIPIPVSSSSAVGLTGRSVVEIVVYGIGRAGHELDVARISLPRPIRTYVERHHELIKVAIVSATAFPSTRCCSRPSS